MCLQLLNYAYLISPRITCLFSIYSSFVDPTVLPFTSRLAEIEDPLAKRQCKLLHDAVVNVTSVPLRLAALKLGIPQDEFQ